MTARTIANTYFTDIVLTSPADNLVKVIGLISVSGGIALEGAPGSAFSWTIDNYGTISSGGGPALFLGAYSTSIATGIVVNETGGFITGAGYGVHVNAATRASVTNDAGGTIAGGVSITGVLGTVVNAGVLLAGGVYEAFGGSVTNLSTGTIIGEVSFGLQGAAATITNAGVILASVDGTAVHFGATSIANRVIAYPGGVFTGSIRGGDGVMELASGASVGTLAGFNGRIITNFSSLQFDSGGQWTVSGRTLFAGLGSIAISGFASGDTIDLSGFIAVSDTFGINSVTFTNTSAQHATLNLQGSFSSADLKFTGDGSAGTDVYVTSGLSPLVYGRTIDDTGIIATSEMVTAGTMTLMNTGGAVGTIDVGVSLNTSDFTLLTDGSGGTDIVVSTVFGIYTDGVTLLANLTTIGGSAQVSNMANGGKAVSGPTGTLWSVTNLGTISESGTAGYGIRLASDGTVVNAGTIEYTGAAPGVVGDAVYLEDGTVVNSGLIGSSGGGIFLGGAGGVSNRSGGTIIGYEGVGFGGGNTDTLTNAGTIFGSGGTAVAFGGSGGTHRLIVDPGAVFTGAIKGGSSATAVMELASAANAGSIGGFGSTITNFTSLVFDPGALWSVAGSGGLGTLGIGGFASGDTIDLTGFAAVSATYASGILTLTNAVDAQSTLNFTGGSLVTSDFVIANDGFGGTSISLQVPSAPPVIGGVISASQAVADTGSLMPFPLVTISDSNTGAQAETLTITLSGGDVDGVLSGTGVSEETPGSGIYTLSAASAAAATTALNALVFTPTAHQVAPGSTVATTFTLSDTDSAAQTGIGGNTTVVAISINDPAVISGTVAGQTVDDNATDDPFSAVTIGDPDFEASETATITLTAAGLASDATGSLSGTGLSKTGVGTYTLAAGSPSVATAALRALLFTPTVEEMVPGATVTTGMTLSVTDGIAGSPTRDATTTVVATAVAPPVATGPVLPSIIGAAGELGVPNQTASEPFAAVTEVDPAMGATVTVTVTLSVPGNGTLSNPKVGSNLATGVYNVATGVYSVTGTAAADTAALDALVFTPIAQPNADVTTTGFAISPGAGGTVVAITSVTSVEQILGLADVPTDQIALSVSPDGSGFAAAVSGVTNEAVVLDPVSGDTYTVPAGYQALFLSGTANAILSDSVTGSALLVANQGNDELFANAANDVLVGGAGNDSLFGGGLAGTVVGGSGAATVFAGTGGIRAMQGSGPLEFVGGSNNGGSVFGSAGPGAGDLVANLTGTNQTVSVGGSAATITASGSDGVVIGGGAPLRFTDTGVSDTIAAGSGSVGGSLSGANALIVGGSQGGAMSIVDNGSGDTILGGSGATTVTATTAVLVYGGSGALNFVGGAGIATVLGGSGSESLTAGAGGLVFAENTDNNATVNSGAGSVTIFGATGKAVNLTGNSGMLNYLVAGGGNETLNAAGSSSSNLLKLSGAAGSTLMIGGVGNDTMVAGTAAGSTTMTGGGGSDTFVFFRQEVGGANDVIMDFNSGDTVFIEGYAGSGQAAILQQTSTISARGLMLTLSDGTTITFANLTNRTALDGKIQYQ